MLHARGNSRVTRSYPSADKYQKPDIYGYFGSRLFEAGLDMPRVAMISGHLSWATLRRYTHLKPSDVVKKMQELEKAIAAKRQLASVGLN